MGDSSSRENPSSPNNDETIIFPAAEVGGGSDSSQPTLTPSRPEIDTETVGFSGDLVSAEEELGQGKTRRGSATTSGFGSNLQSSAASAQQEPAQPITDLETLQSVLLSLEFIDANQWDQAFQHAGDQPSVASVLSQLMTMPASWDPKSTVLTDYQCDEIAAGRAAELRFNQYTVLSLLGEGGMGKVFKARHIYLDAIHALKTIRRDRFGQAGTANPEVIHTMVKRFLGEFRGMAKLLVAKDPEHFAQVHDAGEADGIPYYAMEFIDGESLDDKIRANMKNNELPSLEESLTLFAEVADAVGTAHDLNIVHRDLTPRNIMITRRGRPKIIDFGIAKELKRDEETGAATAGLTELTTSGQQVGSRPYMSPEQHAGDIERINFSTDVYVLAATLFQYLTLQLPFPGTTAMEVMLKHLAPDRPKPSSLRLDVPADLDDVIQKALAIEPGDRYQTMDEFKQALLSARTVVADPSLARKRPVTKSKKSPVAVGGLLGAVVLGGVAFFWFNRQESPTRTSRPSLSINGVAGAAGTGSSPSPPAEPTRFEKLSKQIETLRSDGKHAEAITQCQSLLAETGLTDLQKKKLIDDLLDSTAAEYIPPTTPDDADSIMKIVEPYRGGASTIQYAIDGLLSRAITQTSLASRANIGILAAGSKTGESPRSAAVDRFKSWWNDASISFEDRLDCLKRLGELDNNEAVILAQSAVAQWKETAQQQASKNRQEAITTLARVRPLVDGLSLKDMQPQLGQIDLWERVLRFPSLDAASSKSAQSLIEGLPKTRAELDQLDSAFAELGLDGGRPSDLAAQAIDIQAKEILGSATAEQRDQINQLNDRAVSLGIADRSSQLAMHFGSQAFKEIAEIVTNPNFNLEELDKRVRDFGDRLNEDQRGVVDAIKSVRLKAYVAAAAKFRELKLNTSVPPWGAYRAESLIEELAMALNQTNPNSEAIGKQLVELGSTYGLQPEAHPRYAALKAKYETSAGQFALATRAITEGLKALAAEDAGSKLWPVETARQELRDAGRLLMDQAIATSTEMIDRGEDPSEVLNQAESVASLRLVDNNPLGLDDDAKSAFRNRSSRLGYLRGRFFFHQRRYADATQQLRKIDSSLLSTDAFKDARAYWLISQTFAEANIPAKLVTSDDAPFVPDSIKGKSEESLLRALWEMGKDLGAATQTQTLASAATYSTLLSQYFDQRTQSPPENQPSAESIAHVVDVYLSTLADLPRRTQGWERSINLPQLIDPNIPDQDKSLRQVEVLTRELVAIAGHVKGIVKDEDLATLNRICLLMSTKPVGIYSSVVKETPIGENTPYKYYVFNNEAFNAEFGKYMDWSSARIDSARASTFAADPTIGPFIAVWNRARMRFAYFQKDWPLCLQSARNLIDLDSPLRDEQPETEVANLCDAFFKETKGKSVEEVNKIVQQMTEPTSRQLPGKDYSASQLATLKRWRAMFQLVSHLNGLELSEADRKQAISEIETFLTTWNGTDSAAIKWPIWERPIVLGYYQKYSAEAKPAVETLARLPVPRLSPTLEKSLSEAATAWKVPPKS